MGSSVFASSAPVASGGEGRTQTSSSATVTLAVATGPVWSPARVPTLHAGSCHKHAASDSLEAGARARQRCRPAACPG